MTTTPEPVPGATQDPRIQAVAEWLGNLQGDGGTYSHLAKICLAHADAADAAAGIRRVPAKPPAADPTVEESHGYYVVTFPDGSTSTWATNQSYLFDPGSILQRRRNADALDAVARYRAGAS